MPLKIRSLTISILIICFTSNIISSQTNECHTAANSNFTVHAFNTFQKDLFNHYNFGNDTIKTYRTFLMEVVSLSIDLRNLPSAEAIQITRTFKKKSSDKNSIWIKLREYQNQEVSKISPASTSPPIKKANEEEIYTFNYRGDFIQCLKTNSKSADFRDVINSLEANGNISTSLISQRIYYLTDTELSLSQVKKFIAFDIYYSILMVIEKAFG